MIVHPDLESQLEDPTFNPPGCVQVRVPKTEYDSCQESEIAKNAKLLRLVAARMPGDELELLATVEAKAAALERAEADELARRAAFADWFDSLTPQQRQAYLSGEISGEELGRP